MSEGGGGAVPWRHVALFLLTVLCCVYALSYRAFTLPCTVRHADFITVHHATYVQALHQPPPPVGTAPPPVRRTTVISDPNRSEPDISYSAASFDSRCLPTAVIVGAKKAGTRALIQFLKLHPRVIAVPNEVHFFDRDENYSQGLEWYRKQVPVENEADCVDKTIVEKTPYYFVDERSHQRMLLYNSSLRLILLARHPVKRIVSDQSQLIFKTGGTTPSLAEKVLDDSGEVDIEASILQPSLYAKHFSRLLRLFPREQIHVVDADSLAAENPFHQMSQLETFLGLPRFYSTDTFVFNETKGFYCMRLPAKVKCLNSAKGRPHAAIDPGLLHTLSRFFRPHNQRFYQLSGSHFHWDDAAATDSPTPFTNSSFPSSHDASRL